MFRCLEDSPVWQSLKCYLVFTKTFNQTSLTRSSSGIYLLLSNHLKKLCPTNKDYSTASLTVEKKHFLCDPIQKGFDTLRLAVVQGMAAMFFNCQQPHPQSYFSSASREVSPQFCKMHCNYNLFCDVFTQNPVKLLKVSILWRLKPKSLIKCPMWHCTQRREKVHHFQYKLEAVKFSLQSLPCK